MAKIGIFYSDDPKPFSRVKAFDYYLNHTEIRTLMKLENERQNIERCQMIGGGNPTATFLNRINEEHILVAYYYRCIFKQNGKRVKKNYINYDTKLLVETLLEILIKQCNVYYYPGKKRFLPNKDNNWTLVDVNGKVIKEYKENEMYTETIHDTVTGNKLHIIHFKEFYKEYNYCEVKNSENAYWEYYYKYDEVGKNCYLQLKFDDNPYDDEESDLKHELNVVYLKDINDKEAEHILDIDRTSYFAIEDEPGNFKVYLRQTMDGYILIPDLI